LLAIFEQRPDVGILDHGVDRDDFRILHRGLPPQRGNRSGSPRSAASAFATASLSTPSTLTSLA
jgi:hypothetical protein